MGSPVPELFTDGIEIIKIDRTTAVPFLLLNADNKNTKEVVILFHDFFDSLCEYRAVFEKIAKDQPDKKFLLFNYPGNSSHRESG